MDSETITAHQIGYTYMINSYTFAKRYKDAHGRKGAIIAVVRGRIQLTY